MVERKLRVGESIKRSDGRRCSSMFGIFFGVLSISTSVSEHMKNWLTLWHFLYRVCHVNIQAHKLTQHDWPCSNFFILFFLVFFSFGHSVAARTKTERADSSGISLFIIIFIYDMRTFNSANMSSHILISSFPLIDHFFRCRPTIFFFFQCSLLFFLAE